MHSRKPKNIQRIKWAMFLDRNRRHLIAQKIFWNPLGGRFVKLALAIQTRFNTVIRNNSLSPDTNGEEWIINLIEKDSTVFDVGFHRGDFCKDVLQKQPTVRLIAFDPARFAKEEYEKNFKDNPSIRFEDIALSSKSGRADFYDYDNMCNSLAPRVDWYQDAQPKEKYSVRVRTLDDYCSKNVIEQIHFLKIDAEGYDLHVLEGAHNLLESQKIDMFMFEFASGWVSSRRYLQEADSYIRWHPYSLFKLFNGFLSPFTYNYTYDACCLLHCIYVGVSNSYLKKNKIPIKEVIY